MKDGMKRTLSRENRLQDLLGRPDMAAMDGIESPAEKAYPFLHPWPFPSLASGSRISPGHAGHQLFQSFPRQGRNRVEGNALHFAPAS